ncbi:signal transducer and activator of transcription 1-alpha/beta-like isoform X2 [Betta splendens]|uniref:Signal transducer and activator of transcription n=1 Tax=Betta splendens TaxID=158456 RepID=A0A6P7LB57_BETSP|nr:signal transducer and activator of transcription 1-alpha/beta-like isoform X2 [Betta splendens]
MSQWQELLRLNLVRGHLSHLYETTFPRHIRHSLCCYIESQDWDSAAVDECKANACFYALMLYLDEQKCSVQENNVLQAPDFPGMQDYLLKHFSNEPQRLAVVLSECLKEEKKVLALTSEPQPCVSPSVENNWSKLDNTVSDLKRQIMELKKENKTLEVLYENLDYIQKTWLDKVQQHTGPSQSQALNEECLKHTNFIIQTKQVVLQKVMNILNQVAHVVTVLVGVELPEWKRRQQMSCIGCPADTSLDHLQKWFTTVAEVLLHVRQQVQKMQDQDKKYNNSDVSNSSEAIDTCAQSLVMKLLTNALVVEKQPVMSSLLQRPLILKAGVRFTATVRFLINLPEFKDLLKVTPVFDKDVEAAVKGFRQFNFVRDNSKRLDVDSPGGGLAAEFAYMDIKRKTKAPNEQSHVGVCEELHLVTFVTTFQIAGLECNIQVSSLPVVVISSSSQVCSAWASVMWWNMLSPSEPWNLSLFSNPPPLSWQQLSQVLSWQFLAAGQRGLDENQLLMLRDKVGVDPEGLVYWSNFFKNESAWIWIDGILDLIRKYLVDLWREGHIMGFVSRERTRVLLQEKCTGTFLLRFSESSKEGAISFSWVKHSNGEAHVHAVEPYTKKELEFMSLPDVLCSYSVGSKFRKPLVFLYPDIPKDVAFGRYYSSDLQTPKQGGSGYVDRRPVHVSLLPLTPHSPTMEMNAEPETMELEQWFEEMISDILTLPAPP